MSKNTRIVSIRSGFYIADTNAYTAAVSAPDGIGWKRVFAHEATVIDSITAVDVNAGVAMTTMKLPAGAEWFGQITAIQLTSGSVTLYQI